MILKKNRRADEMWTFIEPLLARLAGEPASLQREPHKRLAGLDVIDLGIGYGDFMLKSLQSGADFVLGTDINKENMEFAFSRLVRSGYRGYFRILESDLNRKSDRAMLFQLSFDVGICTSVLPYLDFPDDLLFMMSEYCTISIIECQYHGDGPGLSHIRDDNDMQEWLGRYWHTVQKIGQTELDIRPASRSVWACAIPNREWSEGVL
ncbi:MAG: methyltransferase domain-containing protein [Planctomycetota bacterium]|jgi:hypothetical protein